MANIGSLAVQIVASTKGLTGGLASAAKSLAGFASQAATGFGTFGLAVEGVQKLGSIFDGVLGTPIKLAGELEQMTTAFEVMLGSAAKAGKLVEEIQKFAAETPFETAPLVQASKQLLGTGFGAGEIIPTLRVLGDLASGTGSSVEELVFLLGQMKSQGRVMTQDMNQFATRNIPIWKEMASVLGVTEGKLRLMVEEGKIGFNEVAMVLNKLTAQGSQFGGMMDKQSKTLFGLTSTLRDEFFMTLTRIGQMEVNAFNMKGVVARVTEGLASIRRNVDLLKPVFEAVGAVFRAAFDAALGGAMAAAPMIKTLAESFQTFDAEKIRANVLGLIEKLTEVVLNFSVEAAKAFEGLTRQLAEMGSEAAKVAKSFDTLNKAGSWVDDKTSSKNLGKTLWSLTLPGMMLGALSAVGPKGKQAGLAGVAQQVESSGLLKALESAQAGLSQFFSNLRDQTKEAASGFSLLKDSVTAAFRGIGQAGIALEVNNKNAEEMARKLTAEFQTPMQKYTKRIEEINMALQQGGLDWDIYARAVAAAVDELEKASDLGGMRLPQAMSKDSAEAVSTLNRNLSGQGRDRDIPGLLKRAADLEKMQLEKLQELVRRFNEAAPLRIVGGL